LIDIVVIPLLLICYVVVDLGIPYCVTLITLPLVLDIVLLFVVVVGGLVHCCYYIRVITLFPLFDGIIVVIWMKLLV